MVSIDRVVFGFFFEAVVTVSRSLPDRVLRSIFPLDAPSESLTSLSSSLVTSPFACLLVESSSDSSSEAIITRLATRLLLLLVDGDGSSSESS